MLRLEILKRREAVSLGDAPVAKEGFFVTHFLTVRDQARRLAEFNG